MAQKRKVDTGTQAPPQQTEKAEPSDSGLPRWLQEQSWSQWLRGPFARSFFVLFCFAFDVFLGLELADLLGDYAWAALLVLALIIAVEATAFLYLWGSEGKMW